MKQFIKNRIELLKLLPKGMVCAEIGVLAGDYSKSIHEIMKPSGLYLIDHFSGMLLSGDHNGENVQEYDLDQEYVKLESYFSKNPEVKLIKGFSYDVLPEYPDDFFDFVYIDSDHTYEGTKNELIQCFKKVRSGGFICGHDYSEDHFPECKRAIDEFCKEFGQEIVFETIEDRMASFLIQLDKSRDLVAQVLASDFSLLSVERMENLKRQIDYVIKNNIQGDFVETGVARGGSIIFMKKYSDRLGYKRMIHAFDSFQGFPQHGEVDKDYKNEYPTEADYAGVVVSEESFIKNLNSFGIPKADIVVHKGWFADTTQGFQNNIAILRMDGDWYESTMTVFDNLYDRVVPGGVIIIDDYGWWQGCSKAVHEFFQKRHINQALNVTDGTEVWFIKGA